MGGRMSFQNAGWNWSGDQREGWVPMGGEPGRRPVIRGAASALLRAELDFEQRIAGNRDLALFRRNAATWELLLQVAAADDGLDLGLHGLVQEIRSRGLGPSALLRFLRDRRADGQLMTAPDPDKRSRQRISLRPDLVEALVGHLMARHRAVEDVWLTGDEGLCGGR